MRDGDLIRPLFPMVPEAPDERELGMAQNGATDTPRRKTHLPGLPEMIAPTTRETPDLTSLHKVQTSADHIGEANEKVADHIGDATTMIDHAELLRRVLQDAQELSRRGLNPDVRLNAAEREAVTHLLSEIAALRGERTFLMEQKEGAEDAIFDAITRATQAERQRDKLRRELEFIKGFVTPDQGSSMTDIERVIFARISRVFANQGFDQ